MAATGIGKNTYESIMKEGNRVCRDMASTSFSTPPKTRKRPSPVLGKLTPGQISEIRNIIYNFYIVEKRRPTLSCITQNTKLFQIIYLSFLGILQKLKDKEIGFEGQLSSLNRLLKSLGFRYVFFLHKTLTNLQYF